MGGTMLVKQCQVGVNKANGELFKGFVANSAGLKQFVSSQLFE